MYLWVRVLAEGLVWVMTSRKSSVVTVSRLMTGRGEFPEGRAVVGAGCWLTGWRNI